MARNVFIFLATFAVGALIAFTGRAMRHRPEQAPSEHASHVRAPMVSNPLTSTGATASTASEHAMPDHAAPQAAAAAQADAGSPATVNTVCAICGMKVDPKVPTLEYQGKTIGFGCKLCAPKFKADPDKYGPLYLRNEVIKR